MKTDTMTTTSIKSKIYNILIELGLSPILKGTKILTKVILIAINSKDEFLVLEDVYDKISLNNKSFNSAQIRNSIKYTLDNRNENKSVANFEKIFGYEYDSYFFTNKIIIEEIVRVIKEDSY